MPKLDDVYGDADDDGKLDKAYSRKRPAPSSASSGVSADVNTRSDSSVTERCAKTREVTSKCHKVFNRACAQCWYARHHKAWQASHGSFFAKKGSVKCRVVWLQERRDSVTGAWSMGCAICAKLRSRVLEQGSPRTRRQQRKWDCKWARFEINKLSQLQAAALANHAQSQCHKAAIKSLEDPSLPLEILVQPEAGDEELLKGHVPQPADWLKAFSLIHNPISYFKSEKVSECDTYISIRKKAVSRFAAKKLIGVMAEVVRRKKRTWIQQAAHICVAIDDKAPYRLLRFRVSFGPKDYGDGDMPTRDGVLALLSHGHPSPSTMNVKYLDEDYSARMADSVSKAVEKLATPLDADEPDQDIVTAFCKAFVSVSADGHRANQKCMRILQSKFPGLRLLLLDRAHEIRRAALPITLQQHFQCYFEDVFGSAGKKHALVPDLQNSDAWRLRFLLLQREIVSKVGSLPANVQRASVTLSFARQRFDSCATPQARFVLLLLPLALLLAYQAADERLTRDVRVRSQRLLERLDGERALTAGLSADFTNEVLHFIRCHDVADHDCSRTLMEKEHFVHRVTSLFLHGMVLAESPQED